MWDVVVGVEVDMKVDVGMGVEVGVCVSSPLPLVPKGLQCGLLIGQCPLPCVLKGCYGQQEPTTSRYIHSVHYPCLVHTVSAHAV